MGITPIYETKTIIREASMPISRKYHNPHNEIEEHF